MGEGDARALGRGPLITSFAALVPQPMKTLSGLPRPASYRIRDGAFNLTDLHLSAQVSQRDEAALPSADVSYP